MCTFRVSPQPVDAAESFLFAFEDTQGPASNQTGAITRTAVRMRAPTTAALGRQGLVQMRKQAEIMQAAKTNNINPHLTTILIMFAAAFRCSSKNKAYFFREAQIQRSYALGLFIFQQ